MPGAPSAPDPLARVFLDLTPGAALLPPSSCDLLIALGLKAAAVLDLAGGGVTVVSSRAVTGSGWPPGPHPGESWPGKPHAIDRLTDTGADGGPWGAFLAMAGCRRALLAPLVGSSSTAVLLAASGTTRPFSRPTRQQVERLAAGLSLAVRQPAGTPPGEAATLLDLSRRLAQASDLGALLTVVEEALDRTLDWSACALLAHGAGSAARFIGGRFLGITARGNLEEQLRREAGALGLPWCGAEWDEVPPEEDRAAVTEQRASLVVLPIPAEPAPPGLLAVWVPGPPPGEGLQRLLAALAQQIALFLTRWRRAAEQEDSRLAALLDTLPVGVLLLSPTSHVRGWNTAASVMLGSLAGRPPRREGSLVDLPLPAGLTRAGHRVEFSSRRDQRTYAASWVDMPAGAGPAGRALVLDDVTAERARQEQEIKAERMLAVGEMFSGVAHELNNPLASVVGFSQLLLGQAQEERARRRLSIVAEEAQRARRIVHNLLDVVRPRPPAREPVDLNEVVQGILALFAYQFRLDGVQVEFTPASGLPPVVGDRHQLQQVLVNLVANAQHALRDAQGDRILKVAIDAAGGRIRLQVADTGPGIPSAHLDRIFDRFFTTKEQGIGTGLGLSIAARILEEHGGAIHARSEPSAGAVFTIDLPAGRAAPRPSLAAAAPADHEPGARVLVVEDEDSFRLLLQEALAQENYRVTTAAHGAAALDLLVGGEFDAVVSDLRMPVMDGVQLFQKVRDRLPDLASRFVFMTGDLLDQGTRSFLDECGAPCLPKPFGLEELHRALRSLPPR